MNIAGLTDPFLAPCAPQSAHSKVPGLTPAVCPFLTLLPALIFEKGTQLSPSHNCIALHN